MPRPRLTRLIGQASPFARQISNDSSMRTQNPLSDLAIIHSTICPSPMSHSAMFLFFLEIVRHKKCNQCFGAHSRVRISTASGQCLSRSAALLFPHNNARQNTVQASSFEPITLFSLLTHPELLAEFAACASHDVLKEHGNSSCSRTPVLPAASVSAGKHSNAAEPHFADATGTRVRKRKPTGCRRQGRRCKQA